jgi:hypothetical protein
MTSSQPEDYVDNNYCNVSDDDNDDIYIKSTNDEDERSLKDELKKGSILYQKANCYETHTEEDIGEKMVKMLTELMDSYGLSEGGAFDILHKKGWNKKKAMDYVLEGGEFGDFHPKIDNFEKPIVTPRILFKRTS